LSIPNRECLLEEPRDPSDESEEGSNADEEEEDETDFVGDGEGEDSKGGISRLLDEMAERRALRESEIGAPNPKPSVVKLKSEFDLVAKSRSTM
jgi:hypothetical protein